MTSFRHGHCLSGKRSQMYSVWVDIIRRCESSSHHAFADYGGRGIKICARWRGDFVAFLKDVGPRPSPSHTLDRVKVDGNYSPSNVQWATRKEQARNKRNTFIVLFRGRAMSLAEAVELSGVNYGTAYGRLARGWPLAEALNPSSTMRKAHLGPPNATVAALGRACQAAGLTLKDIERLARRRAQRAEKAA